MNQPDSFSKREVSRAGRHLAERLVAARETGKTSFYDADRAYDREAREVVEWWRAQHVAPMLAIAERVGTLAPSLDHGDFDAVAVSFRPKRFESIVDKLTREPGKLADMADIAGVRAVVNTQHEVDALHDRLAAEMDIRRVRDWTRHPRDTGYRALHLHVRESGRMVEVQLRTFGQDAWANVVEEETRLSGVNYKAGFGRPEVLDYFRAVADMFGAIELGESHPDLPRRLYDDFQRAKPHLQIPALRNLRLE